MENAQYLHNYFGEQLVDFCLVKLKIHRPPPRQQSQAAILSCIHRKIYTRNDVYNIIYSGKIVYLDNAIIQ